MYVITKYSPRKLAFCTIFSVDFISFTATVFNHAVHVENIWTDLKVGETEVIISAKG